MTKPLYALAIVAAFAVLSPQARTIVMDTMLRTSKDCNPPRTKWVCHMEQCPGPECHQQCQYE